MQSFSSWCPVATGVWLTCSALLLLAPSGGSAISGNDYSTPAYLKDLWNRVGAVGTQNPNLFPDYELALTTTNHSLVSAVMKDVRTMYIEAEAMRTELARIILPEVEHKRPDSFHERATLRAFLGIMAYLKRLARAMSIELRATEPGHNEPLPSGQVRFISSQLLISMDQQSMDRLGAWQYVRSVDEAINRFKSVSSEHNNTTNLSASRAEVIDRLKGLQTFLVQDRDHKAKLYYNERERIETEVEGDRMAFKQQSLMQFLIDFDVNMNRFARQYLDEFVGRYPVEAPRIGEHNTIIG